MVAGNEKLTHNTSETNFDGLLSSDNYFVVPLFQRSYRWTKAKLVALEKDIVNAVDRDRDDDGHFLGAIIYHTRPSDADDPNRLELIDGQQRITTVYLYLAAFVQLLAKESEPTRAKSFFEKFLIVPREVKPKVGSNLKLHPGKDDRAAFLKVINHVLNTNNLRGITVAVQILSEGSLESNKIYNTYTQARTFFKKQYEQGGLERIEEVFKTIVRSITVVQIDVKDPTNGPRIFDSLNSKQEPMTTGDLVRNEIFSRVSSDLYKCERLEQESWRPFYQKFEGPELFDLYFFPYGLIRNPNTKKSEVYAALRSNWEDVEDPSEIIDELATFQDSFLTIVNGRNIEELESPICKALKTLQRMSLPITSYPFLMQLLNGSKGGRLSVESAESTLEVIQSFLVRRAVCGYTPAGLHAVFKRLWVDCGGEPSGEKIKEEIRRQGTVEWPDDEEFGRQIAVRNIGETGIAKFMVMEYDRSLRGDSHSTEAWLEHVLPQKPKREWYDVFTEQQHEEMHERLANLLPLTDEMDIALSNHRYSIKQPKYKEESVFKSTRDFAEKWDDWTPESLEERAQTLRVWAIGRWPH